MYYLYHGRKKSGLYQTQQGIDGLEHGHHLTEIHHVGCAVEGIVERICGGHETQTNIIKQQTAGTTIHNPHHLQNKSLLCSHVPVSIQMSSSVNSSSVTVSPGRPVCFISLLSGANCAGLLSVIVLH